MEKAKAHPDTRPGKPPWLRRRLPVGGDYEAVRKLLEKEGLHSVCQEARCPNIWECYARRTATFLIMGPRCTRNCRFCAVTQGPQGPPDPLEPVRVAAAAASLDLRYVVITSVTRDDLPDGGAAHFARTIRETRKKTPGILIEVLIPDFQGNEAALRTVLDASPSVLNHNLETVSSLYPRVRPEADYRRSLELLRRSKTYAPSTPTKSGLMLGLGETAAEVRDALNDLRRSGCSMLTLGQYLQPSRTHLEVSRFVPPDEFDAWRKEALGMGFSEAAAGPFVRSSYHAREHYEAVGKVEGSRS
jgi:lipoic acid synthetase